MRIIGKTENGFILEANKNEVANLVGFYWMGDKASNQLTIGTEIKVHAMYQQLYDLAGKQSSLKTHADALRTLANLLEITMPTIPNVKVARDGEAL